MLPQFHFTRVSYRFSLKSTPLEASPAESGWHDCLIRVAAQLIAPSG